MFSFIDALKIALTLKMHKYFFVNPNRVNLILLKSSVTVVYCKVGYQLGTVVKNLIMHVTKVLLLQLRKIVEKSS